MMFEIDAGILGDARSAETLCYYDGERIFIVRHDARNFYVHSIDDHASFQSYWVVEITPAQEADIKEKKIKLRELICRADPLMYFQAYHDGRLEVFRVYDPSNFPDDYFPDQDVTL